MTLRTSQRFRNEGRKRPAWKASHEASIRRSATFSDLSEHFFPVEEPSQDGTQ